MTLFLVDNSALQRVAVVPAVGHALLELSSRGHALATCAVALDEACFSARSADDLVQIRSRLTGQFTFLPTDPAMDLVMQELRSALFAQGTGRAAGVVDVHLAAVALCHGATVLHYDADFEHLARAAPALQQRWVVPRGSLDPD